jgi:cholinesterase
MDKPSERPSTQIIAFGDSFSDIGHGYVDGNGPTAIACMAAEMGLAMIPGRAASSDLRASRCYAVSGGGSGDNAGGGLKAALLGRGVLAQIADFEEGLRSATVAVDGETLFFIAIGLNDHGLSSEEIAANYHAAIARLHAAGGRRFVLSRLPVIPHYADIARRVNALLGDVVEQAQGAHPDSWAYLCGFGDYFEAIWAQPERYGLENVTDACAPGRALFDQDAARVGDPAKYFYYHPDHPSAATHALVGAKLAEELGALFGK